MKNKIYYLLILLLTITISFPSICFSELKTVHKKPTQQSRDLLEEQSSVSGKGSSDWVKYGKTKEGNVSFYKKGNIEKNKGKYIVQVWEKRVYFDEGREKEIQEMRNKEFSTEGYDKLLYQLLLYNIDCNKQKFSLLSFSEYDTNGKVLSSTDFDEQEWRYIPPDSMTDILRKNVCE